MPKGICRIQSAAVQIFQTVFVDAEIHRPNGIVEIDCDDIDDFFLGQKLVSSRR